jgi:hypothetical protein
LGASCHTSAAAGAFIFVQGQLHRHLLRFGVTAPSAAQVAALKKHCGANARSIVEAEFLDVENMAFHYLPPPVFLNFIVEFAPKYVNKPQKKNPGSPGFSKLLCNIQHHFVLL